MKESDIVTITLSVFKTDHIWFGCRWTLLSRRLPTWITWPSCMRAGLHGCECSAASCLVQRRLGDPPESSGTWVSTQQYQAILGEEYGTWMLSPPSRTPGYPNWGSNLVALLQPHSPQQWVIGLTRHLVRLLTGLPFWGLSGHGGTRRGRREGRQKPPHPQLENTFPLSPTLLTVKLYL